MFRVRIILISLALFTCLSGKSQTWFDLGIKGGVGTGLLLNKTISEDTRLGISPGFNYFYGGKVGVNFGEMLGLAVDITLSNNSFGYIQSEVDASQLSYKYFVNYNALEVAPLFRYTKEASYLEVGPMFSFNSKANFEDESPWNNTPSNPEEYISRNTTRLIFGFGGHMIGNEVISLMAGLRFSYTLGNLISDTWNGSNFPFANYSDITANNSSNPLRAQFVFELNYSLGYFVTASCGRRTAFLTF